MRPFASLRDNSILIINLQYLQLFILCGNVNILAVDNSNSVYFIGKFIVACEIIRRRFVAVKAFN